MNTTTNKNIRIQQCKKAQDVLAQGMLEAVNQISGKEDYTPGNLGIPFNPFTGREYSGAAMVRLMLESLGKGYQDNRWLAKQQMTALQKRIPSLHLEPQCPGVRILLPELVSSIQMQDGSQHILTADEYRVLFEQDNDALPQVQHAMLFVPQEVLNASTIEGFPSLDKDSPSLTLHEQQALVSRFVASSGVHILYENRNGAYYDDVDDTILISVQAMIARKIDWTYAKLLLREFYHASKALHREYTDSDDEPYDLQEIDTELFTTLACAYVGIPRNTADDRMRLHDTIFHIRTEEPAVFFQQATAAAKMLSVLHQFHHDEQPCVRWFPQKGTWQDLQEQQDWTAIIYITRRFLYFSLHYLLSKSKTEQLGKEVIRIIQHGSFVEMRDMLFTISQILITKGTLRSDDARINLSQKMFTLWCYLKDEYSDYGTSGTEPKVRTQTTMTPAAEELRMRMR